MSESLQAKNRRKGRRFERKKVDQLSRGDCIVAARFGETASNVSTPDVYCMRGGKYPKHRLIEAKNNTDKYIPPDQREELCEIIDRYSDEFPNEMLQVEVFFRPSPRKTKTRKVHKPGDDPAKSCERIENEFGFVSD